MEKVQKARRHRWRSPGSKKEYKLTPSVIAILRLMARYRYLRTTFIERFLSNRHPNGLRKTLARMIDAGLLHKPSEQREGYNSLWCPDVYELTEKGEQALAGLDATVLMATRLWKEERGHFRTNFAHSLAVCDVIASIELGAGDRFVTWQEIVAGSHDPHPLRLHYCIRYDGKSYESYLVSDGLFAIRHPEHGKVSYFLLEVEREGVLSRSSPDQSSRFKKLLAYDNIDDTKEYKKRLNIGRPRVLIALRSQRVLENTKRLIEKELGETELFLMHAVPMQDGSTSAPPPFPDLLGEWWETTAGPRRIDRLSVAT